MVVESDGRWQEVRFNDYTTIYGIPGLYEEIFYDVLSCDSPRFMCEFLSRGLTAEGADPGRLRVLDLGAGNGVVGAELRAIGVGFAVGVDILDAAAQAAARDRPGCYDDYHVTDLAEVPEDEVRALRTFRFNALTCVHGLGFGEVPADCFRTAFNLIGNGGWIVVTVKERSPEELDPSGIGTLIAKAARNRALEIVRSEVYRHRMTTNGEPLHYTGILARKCAPLLPARSPLE